MCALRQSSMASISIGTELKAAAAQGLIRELRLSVRKLHHGHGPATARTCIRGFLIDVTGGDPFA